METICFLQLQSYFNPISIPQTQENPMNLITNVPSSVNFITAFTPPFNKKSLPSPFIRNLCVPVKPNRQAYQICIELLEDVHYKYHRTIISIFIFAHL